MRKATFVNIATFIALVVSACATIGPEKPGNPLYSWLNGRWRTGPVELHFRVVNDNQVVGDAIFDGGVNRGNVSGTVAADKAKVETYWRSGPTTVYEFMREGETVRGVIVAGRDPGLSFTLRKIQ